MRQGVFQAATWRSPESHTFLISITPRGKFISLVMDHSVKIPRATDRSQAHTLFRLWNSIQLAWICFHYFLAET